MKRTILKISESLFQEIDQSIFRNYPHDEWGVFLKTNWSELDDSIIITMCESIPYGEQDISFGRGIVRFHEPYIVKALKATMKENVGIAVVHSHPESVPPFPSLVDDDMDKYFQDYFDSFNTSAPYLSLIFRKTKEGIIEFSGRGVLNGKKFKVDELRIIGKKVHKIYAKGRERKQVPKVMRDRLLRLAESYGPDAVEKLWNSEVTIIGCGGTGSPAAHSLSRSGIGTINLIDFDVLNLHNSERVHGSFSKYFEGSPIHKVDAVKDLIKLINPLIKVNIFKGSLLDSEARSMILRSDIVLNCTDTEHAKVATSEFVWRYFCVALQVNVSIESSQFAIEGQIIHLTHLYPDGPCAYCMDMINAQRLSIELMSKEEVESRKLEAEKLTKSGKNGNAYWVEAPIFPTVGSLATIGGEMASNYAIGLITETFSPVSIFTERNLLSPHPDMHLNFSKKKDCLCRGGFGKNDQIGSRGVILK